MTDLGRRVAVLERGVGGGDDGPSWFIVRIDDPSEEEIEAAKAKHPVGGLLVVIRGHRPLPSGGGPGSS